MVSPRASPNARRHDAWPCFNVGVGERRDIASLHLDDDAPTREQKYRRRPRRARLLSAMPIIVQKALDSFDELPARIKMLSFRAHERRM